ncbi:MAG: molybdenum cofactor guanylyltransferase [Thermomicrobiales bacterium]|nr:molybdenum cofactor guanylyltransferase [Thermomicrobiales bacterium]
MDLQISAAVLAGGRSSRMGADKALLSLEPDGRRLAEVVVGLLKSVSDDVFLVSAPRPEYSAFGVPVYADRYGESGPLGGIASAVAQARHEFCLVVSCDMPFLNTNLVRWMAGKPRRYDVLVPQLQGESRQGSGLVFQTMHAIYGKSCLPAMERALAEGRWRTVSFFEDVEVEAIVEDDVRKLDPELRSFFSVNTPEALATAREWRRHICDGDQ